MGGLSQIPRALPTAEAENSAQLLYAVALPILLFTRRLDMALRTSRSSLLSICSFINSFRDIQIHINSTRKREDISCTKQTKAKMSFFSPCHVWDTVKEIQKRHLRRKYKMKLSGVSVRGSAVVLGSAWQEWLFVWARLLLTLLYQQTLGCLQVSVLSNLA